MPSRCFNNPEMQAAGEEYPFKVTWEKQAERASTSLTDPPPKRSSVPFQGQAEHGTFPEFLVFKPTSFPIRNRNLSLASAADRVSAGL